MKKFVFQAIFLLLVTGIALFLFTSGRTINMPFLPENSLTKQVIINDKVINAQLANTKEKRKKGLSGREVLASDEGMLFTFDSSGKHPFWMKDMKIALDFIWIKENKIIDITENVQPPIAGQPDSSLPIYQSKEESDKILEVPAQTVQNLSIKVGDTVKIQ